MSEAPPQSSLTFVHGFLLGYLSVCVLLFFFIKFFIFGDVPPSPSSRRRNHYSSHHRATSFSTSFLSSTSYTSFNASKKSSVLRRTQPYTTPTILSKTYYNTRHHQPESVDWFNVLVAQALAQLRTDAQQDDAILTTLTDLLNGPRRPDFLDEIRVTEVNLGEEFPIFSNCRIIAVDGDGASTADGGPTSRPTSSRSAGGSSNNKDAAAGTRLIARMDVDLSDAITLGIETKVVLHFPRRYVASMPVALAVSVVRFSGTLNVSFVPSSPGSVDSSAGSRRTAPTTLTFSFLPDYRLELSTRSLLGSRARLQDIPKIAQLVEARLHDWFDSRCVEPRFQQVVLPSLWPRAQNTRGGGPEDTTSPGIDLRKTESQRMSFEEAIETEEDSGGARPGPAHGPHEDVADLYPNSAPPPSYNGSAMRKRKVSRPSPQVRPSRGNFSEDLSYNMPGSLPP